MALNTMKDRDEVLEKLHALELKIALEIRRICEKNDIKYFLVAGTLLGAVRHGGFIPWDDDMDIGMRRKDYNRFLEACKTDLGDEFFLQTWDTDPDYPFSYAKIRLNGTRIVEEFAEKANIHKGLFVDVFPFDNAPDSEVMRRIRAVQYRVCKRMLWLKKGMGLNLASRPDKAVKYRVFKFISLFFNYTLLKKYFSWLQTRYNGKETEKIATDGARPYMKQLVRREWTEDLATVSFENESFTTYSDIEAYLRFFYGDYMKLPPENERNAHSALLVDFGPYGGTSVD